jgi:hypothetical protein
MGGGGGYGSVAMLYTPIIKIGSGIRKSNVGKVGFTDEIAYAYFRKVS